MWKIYYVFKASYKVHSGLIINSGVASFLSWETKGGKTFLGGKSIWLPIMHFHNTGHITPFLISSQVPPPLFPWALFPVCFLWFLPFPSLFHSHLLLLPSFDTARGSGERCKLPQRVRRAKCYWVNSGPRKKWAFSNMSKWQTKLQCSRSLLFLLSSHWQHELFWSVD